MKSIKRYINKNSLVNLEDIKSDIEKIFDKDSGGLIVKNHKNPLYGEKAMKELLKILYKISRDEFNEENNI